MIDTSPPADGARPRRRISGRIVAVVLALVVLLAGAGAASAVSLHYLHATPLQCTCAWGWLPPERAHGAGLDESVVDNTPDGRHAFALQVANNSDVTQTVVGLAPDGSGGRVSYGVETDHSRYSPDNMHFARLPVTLHPGDVRYLRLSFRACLPEGGSLGMTGMPLRVRVGAFTRTEHVDIGEVTLLVMGKRVVCHA